MTIRERNLMFTLLTVLGVGGGGLLFYKFLWAPLSDYRRQIATLEQENSDKEFQLMKLAKDRLHLERLRHMGLPSNLGQATSQYQEFLRKLLENSGMTVESVVPSLQAGRDPKDAKKSGHVTLTFNVKAHGPLSALVKSLDVAKRTPLLHRVKSYLIERPPDSLASRDRAGQLNVTMVVEAVVVNRSEKRSESLFGVDPRVAQVDALVALRRGPMGLASLMWAVSPTGPMGQKVFAKNASQRAYESIALQDVFAGKPPPVVSIPRPSGPNVLEHIYLASITLSNRTFRQHEAFLRNHLAHPSKTPQIRVSTDSGLAKFRIRDEDDDVIFEGQVLRIDPRDLYFQVGEDTYVIHIDETLAYALRRPLSDAELAKVGLLQKANGKAQQTKAATDN